MTDGTGTESATASAKDDPSARSVGRGTLVAGVVVALIVGIVVGGAIGWKVEQRRVKDDVEHAKATARAQAATNIRPFGLVTAVSGDSVTVSLQTGEGAGSRTYRLTSDTVIDRAVAGERQAIVKGAKVLVRPDAGGGAAEIIVLPASTTFGTR